MTELRHDLQNIAELIPEGAKVLDIGCGNGQLLDWLVRHKQVDARGLEMQPELVSKAIGKGLAAVQGNAETDLEFYLSQSYDVVVLSRTLQAMHDPIDILNHVIRIGKKAIVSVPNFANLRNRYYLAIKGRMPVTSTLTYEWYNTPNIHFCTIRDFEILCEKMGVTIEKKVMLDAQGHKKHMIWPNLLADQGVFVLRK